MNNDILQLIYNQQFYILILLGFCLLVFCFALILLSLIYRHLKNKDFIEDKIYEYNGQNKDSTND